MQVVSEEITSACRWRRRRGLTQVLASPAGRDWKGRWNRSSEQLPPMMTDAKEGATNRVQVGRFVLVLAPLTNRSCPLHCEPSSESPLLKYFLLLKAFGFRLYWSSLFWLLKVSYSSRKVFLYWGESLRRLEKTSVLPTQRTWVTCWQVCRRDNFFSGELWSFVRD